MEAKYAILNEYRTIKGISMRDFAKDIGLSMDIVRRTLKGISEPHDFNRGAFDRYYEKHRADINQVISEQ